MPTYGVSMIQRSPKTADWLAFALVLLLLPGPAGASESERAQPASIEADRAEIDRASGVSRYFGNVVFTQGTLRLTGEQVTVRTEAGIVRAAESHGEPATVRQQTDDGRLLRAEAERITYDAAIPRVTLTGKAELTRGTDRFAAGFIRYWPNTGRVEAERGEGDERVRIRIEPDEDDGAAGADE